MGLPPGYTLPSRVRGGCEVFFFFAPFGVANSAAVGFSWIVYGMVVLLGVIGGVIYATRRETRLEIPAEAPPDTASIRSDGVVSESVH